MFKKSIELFSRAQKSIPGGVNSPVRAFKSVGGTPIFMKDAKGAYLYDVDGHQYIDYINSWGPMILGHCHPRIVQAVKEQAEIAFSYGTVSELEIALAEQVKKMVPSIDMIRLVSSGTEACMSAIRLAKAFTQRNKIIKCDGCYHGHADPFLVQAGSGVASFGIQTVPGVSSDVAKDTISVPYNDIQALKMAVDEYPQQIAAIIIEPVAGNMGCIIPKSNYLQELRALCDYHKIILIFDEVMTGFRLAKGGAQERFHVQADLVCYGKIIGGGMPLAAFAGKKEILSLLAPEGQVYQAGTLSGNPLAVVSGLTTLKVLDENPQIYMHLDNLGVSLKKSLENVFKQVDISASVQQIGSMISVFFSECEIMNFNEAKASDTERFKRYFHHMLAHQIYLPPSAFETWFISNAISEADFEKTIQASLAFNG